MSAIKRIFRFGLGLTLIFSTMIVLSTTEAGLKLDMRLLTLFNPDLKFEKVTGTLLNHFIIEGIEYPHQKQTIKIHKIDMTWSPLDYFAKGHLDIRQLNIVSDYGQLSAQGSEDRLTFHGESLAPYSADFSGTLNRKNNTTIISLQTAFHDISVPLPQPLSMMLKSSDITLSLRNHRPIHYHGTLQTSAGPITLHGNDRTINITSPSLKFVSGKEYDLTVQPTLVLTKTDAMWRLTGLIDLPFARIHPNALSQADTLPDDLAFVQEFETIQPEPSIELDLDLRLGQDVHLHYLGLDANLAGSVKLKTGPDQLPRGQGEIAINNGHYEAYGQHLTIEKGRLIFDGGVIENPIVELSASKEIKLTVSTSTINNIMLPKQSSIESLDKITVGIIVDGKIAEPKIRLFSRPSDLSKADILSYLILGRPLQAGNQQESQVLLAAASSLGNGNNEGAKLLKQVQKKLGIDDLHLTNETTFDPNNYSFKDNTALLIGKSVSKRIYISYSVALQQATNIFRVRYLIQKNWNLQVQTDGNNSGIDLLWTTESE